MYSVSILDHERHGNVISISIEEDGIYLSPFKVIDQIKFLKRTSKNLKTRILIDNQILTIKQAEKWATEQYKSLPKCYGCACTLAGEVFTHRLREKQLFCSQKCADRDYYRILDDLNDEEEIDYL